MSAFSYLLFSLDLQAKTEHTFPISYMYAVCADHVMPLLFDKSYNTVLKRQTM
jgi:hypothetical protein